MRARVRGMGPQQCRAARAWLGWSQEDLAKKSNVSGRTVAAFEREENQPQTNNLRSMERVILEAGLRLLFDTQGNPVGIALRDVNMSEIYNE